MVHLHGLKFKRNKRCKVKILRPTPYFYHPRPLLVTSVTRYIYYAYNTSKYVCSYTFSIFLFFKYKCK